MSPFGATATPSPVMNSLCGPSTVQRPCAAIGVIDPEGWKRASPMVPPVSTTVPSGAAASEPRLAEGPRKFVRNRNFPVAVRS